FDPTSVYRALHVLRFMDDHGLTPRVLRTASLRQTALLIEAYDRVALSKRGIELATPREARGGFVALRTPRAKELQVALRQDGVRTDVRGELLRMGPAPYLKASAIDRAMEHLDRRA